MFIFWPTKSGKSTLLSRIKSSRTEDEFLKLLKQSEEMGNDVFELDGISIRSGYLACTTVPNPLVKDDKLFLDLAGFEDATPERATVISLLNNSLFPRLNTCKILVVLDLGIINNLNITLKSYVKEFKKLLMIL